MQRKTVPAGIESYQRGRTDLNRALVQQAIDDLSCSGERISFRSVAEKSGVCRSTLYRNGVFRAMVEGARDELSRRAEEEELAAQVKSLQSQVDELTRHRLGCASVDYALVGTL